MDTLIELNEADLDAIAGGIGFASFSFANQANGNVGGTVSAVVLQASNATSAAQAALITSQAV